MRADLVVKGKTLTGTSDLTLFAPLKKGLVPSLEALTYRTRTLRLLKLLNGGRSASHEFAFQRPISDSVERVAVIHSFRVAVVEPDQVLLAVTFDGTWESYIRILWQKVGSLLDIIFCNTEGYVLSTGGFEAWCGWVRRVQVETGFFFTTHGLTVDDAHYLRAHERIVRSQADPAIAALAAARLAMPTAEEQAATIGRTTPKAALETVRQGLQSLALLFRLTDLYLPGTEDGDVLLDATRNLLVDFRALVEDPNMPPELRGGMEKRFGRQLAWMAANDRPHLVAPRPVPPAPVGEARVDDPADVQGGMLAGYDDATHACLVLVGLDDAAAGARLLDALKPHLTTAAGRPGPDGKPTLAPSHDGAKLCNVAFSLEGLRRLGMTEAELQAWLPPEFREGMEARASMLGDYRANHPRRWALPQTNWNTAPAQRREVQMSAVHAVLQLRVQDDPDRTVDDPDDERYPLRAAIRQIVEAADGTPLPGVRVLAVQPMQRVRNRHRQVVEHFGFADGESQPQWRPPAKPSSYANQVQLGEVLLGYANEADAAPVAKDADDEPRLRFLHNGSFMVVRKLRQDVPRLREIVLRASRDTGLDARVILAKMMGRWQGGTSLVTHPHGQQPAEKPDNDFDYRDDAQGSVCPFHSHVRRTNPRDPLPRPGEPPGRRRPRIVRRGMAYGRKAEVLPGDGDVDDGREVDDREQRGLVFIAYNASIAEQFEVVQRWIAGGNSSHGFSGHNDPFLGVPEPGQQRWFQFEATSGPNARPKVYTIDLDAGPGPFDEPRPFVQLQWGGYYFVPSMHTLDWLAARARQATGLPAWPLQRGADAIDETLRHDASRPADESIAAWKSLLEDPGAQEDLRSAGVWAAVRERHGGALRTPYGVLVASRALVDEVLGDDRRFSVSGYHERMTKSRFEIYLGLDSGPRYDALAAKVNAAIGRITKEQGFALAHATAAQVLQGFVDGEKVVAALAGASRWELNIDAKEVIDRVQQVLCQQWLGLPTEAEQGALVPGSWRWDWRTDEPPIYPTHFTPPSRYFFQPRPAATVEAFGQKYAAALAGALEALVEPHRRKGTVPQAPPLGPDGARHDAPLAKAILQALSGESDAVVARTFAGVLMGFLPTFDGALRLVLNEWMRLQTLWELRAAWWLDAAPASLAKAEAHLEPAMRRAMQFRPSPEVIWRTAVQDDDRIGGVALKRGDTIVVSLVSALHEALQKGDPEVCPVFGGDRSKPKHPTHACPGYEAAMGVMLGVLGAFVGVPATLRPSPAPLAFTIEGPM